MQLLPASTVSDHLYTFTSNITWIKQFPNVIYVNHEQQRPEAASLNYSTNYFLCIWQGVAHPYTLRTHAEEIWNPGQQVAIYSVIFKLLNEFRVTTRVTDWLRYSTCKYTVTLKPGLPTTFKTLLCVELLKAPKIFSYHRCNSRIRKSSSKLTRYVAMAIDDLTVVAFMQFQLCILIVSEFFNSHYGLVPGPWTVSSGKPFGIPRTIFLTPIKQYMIILL